MVLGGLVLGGGILGANASKDKASLLMADVLQYVVECMLHLEEVAEKQVEEFFEFVVIVTKTEKDKYFFPDLECILEPLSVFLKGGDSQSLEDFNDLVVVHGIENFFLTIFEAGEVAVFIEN